MKSQSFHILADSIENDNFLLFLTDYFNKTLHGMSADAVTGYGDEFVIELLENFQPLLCSDTSHQRLAKVVSIGITHQTTEVILDLLDDQVNAVDWSFLQEVLHHARTFLSA